MEVYGRTNKDESARFLLLSRTLGCQTGIFVNLMGGVESDISFLLPCVKLSLFSYA